ncbi:MAG TPA: M1 family metallopeptidase [Longimicrobiales bacterium]|nr:M1 family metallopeptidase [Longimicrobiales bacterium]
MMRAARWLAGGALFLTLSSPVSVQAQQWLHDDGSRTNKSMFRLLDEWPDPSDYRNAAGLPGPRYWQQQADYRIRAVLDTVDHVITGSERITYHNNSPDVLRFVWLQLDQNTRSEEYSRAYRMQGALPEQVSPRARQFLGLERFDGGHRLSRVQVVDAAGALVDAKHFINNTVMRVDLAEPLEPGGMAELEIDWSYRVPDSGRGGKELVSDGWIYEMAQWFPRMSVYDDVNGWQTDQFLGRGEFYLNFGDYDVEITVPRNHIVDATGELQNAEAVLTPTQLSRLEAAYRSEEPSFIVTADEVMDPAARPAGTGMLTWRFKAENVRDFAWVSSKTYVWDAAGYSYPGDDRVIKVHSLYPRDAMPLWDKVSTRATVQTLKTYGRLAFEYPYPKAVNANGLAGGMEYPMIAFCGARPQPDGTYSEGTERALIGVTIHEVGHNWFPMIVATDERKWTWMDEGLNTFLQYYGEIDYAQTYCGGAWTQTEDCSYPSRRGPPANIVAYMQDPDQVPLMTESDLIHKDFGNNGYAKPATGLVMLREHILDTPQFDAAFQGYSQGWMFKHPQPADFFRSMDDGAGENLAWFWRGWFYTTHANDQAVTDVSEQAASELVGDDSRGSRYVRIRVDNVGGLVMPLEMDVVFSDGTRQRLEYPVDVWRNNEKTFIAGFFTDKTVVEVVVDPDEGFADIDRENNVWRRAVTQ